jgi:hypothetical protein
MSSADTKKPGCREAANRASPYFKPYETTPAKAFFKNIASFFLQSTPTSVFVIHPYEINTH